MTFKFAASTALASALLWATPLSAQSAAPSAPATKAAEAQPAADRIAAAKPVIDKLWPLGTYRKMMDGQMADMVNGMMASMFDMKSEDLLPGADIPESEKGKTLGEVASAQDPHFRERFRIMMDVMFKEMAPIMDKVEPGVRTALTTDYARKYTPAQLNDLDRFLATPTGKVYSQNWVTSFYSPEMMGSMKDFIPEVMSAMPDIMKKFEQATAHLPPAPKPEAASDAEAAAEAASEAVSAAVAGDGEDPNPVSKWSAADRELASKMQSEVEAVTEKQQLITMRYELHALEAKERSGQKLDEYEIDQRDYLRETLKGKK